MVSFLLLHYFAFTEHDRNSCAPRLLMGDGEAAMAVVRETCLHPRPGFSFHIFGQMAKNIFFDIDSSPFVSSWDLGEPLKGSAIQESPTSNVARAGWQAQPGLHSSQRL